MTNTKKVLPTKNEGWGFWGTTSTQNNRSYEVTEKRWAEAFITLLELSKISPERIRRFLDSRSGRHLADACYDKNSTVAETIKNQWQHSWFKREVFHKAYTVSDEEYYEE